MPDNPERKLFDQIEAYSKTVLPAYPQPGFSLRIGIRGATMRPKIVTENTVSGSVYPAVCKFEAVREGEAVTYIVSPV